VSPIARRQKRGWRQSQGLRMKSTDCAINVYLHYVFDLWVNVWRTKWARGEVVIIRFANDTILGFQYRTDADRFLENLLERLAKFGLELHPDKTRRIEFGRFAEENRKRRGEDKPRDVRFPGHYTYQCKERDGAIHRARQDDPQAHAGQAATDQAGAPHAHARSRASNWRMAQIGCVPFGVPNLPQGFPSRKQARPHRALGYSQNLRQLRVGLPFDFT
jgi:hypothetical protein